MEWAIDDLVLARLGDMQGVTLGNAELKNSLKLGWKPCRCHLPNALDEYKEHWEDLVSRLDEELRERHRIDLL